MNNFRKMGIICLTVGAVLIMSALLLLVHNHMEDKRAAEAVEQVMPEIREFITAKAAERQQMQETQELPEVQEDVPDMTESLEEAEAPGGAEEPAEEKVDVSALSEPKKKMTVEEIAGYGYVGILTIPSLGLDLPIMDECTDSNLTLAPCRYHGSLQEDNLVIAGHNYRHHFGNLSSLAVGDSMTFTAMDGSVYTYEVGAVEVLASTAVDEMNNSEWELSLYTCTYRGSERITVRCALVK